MSDPRSCDLTEISGAVYAGEIPSSVAGWYFHQASAFPDDCVRLSGSRGIPTMPMRSPCTTPTANEAVFAADDLSWRRDSPFRRVDWRWRLAQQSLIRRVPRREELQDPWVRRIRKYLCYLQKAPQSRSSKRTSCDRLLAETAAIRFAADPLIGGELEAWILTGEPPAAVAELSGFEVPVIEAYEACFFDVRPKLDAQSYVVHRVIGPGIYLGFRQDDLAPIWKMIGFFRGRFMLAVALQTFPGSRVRPWPEWYKASPAEQADLIKACRRAIHTRCLPTDISSVRGYRILLTLRALREANNQEQYGLLGADISLLLSEEIPTEDEMRVREKPLSCLSQSPKLTKIAMDKSTA